MTLVLFDLRPATPLLLPAAETGENSIEKSFETAACDEQAKENETHNHADDDSCNGSAGEATAARMIFRESDVGAGSDGRDEGNGSRRTGRCGNGLPS